MSSLTVTRDPNGLNVYSIYKDFRAHCRYYLQILGRNVGLMCVAGSLGCGSRGSGSALALAKYLPNTHIRTA